MGAIRIIKYPPGYYTEWGLIECKDEDCGIYEVYPCSSYEECEELKKDLERPERVNAKLLMYNYHLFSDNIMEAKEKIKKWLKSMEEFYREIAEAFTEIYG